MSSNSIGHTRTIVVDDDPIFRSLATSKLSKHAHEVVESSDGAHAWSLLSRETFHLAIVDLEMPNLRGDELIKCIRGHPRTRHLPIVVITSRNDAEAIRSSLEAGATSFLTKPVNWSMFAHHIEYLLRLTGIAERGERGREEAEARVRALTAAIEPLCGEVAASVDRISSLVRTALETETATGSVSRAATALRDVIAEADCVKARLTAAAEQLDLKAPNQRRAAFTQAGEQLARTP